MNVTLRLALAGSENAITIAEILAKHGILDAEDAASLRGSVNNIDFLGMPKELVGWKSEQMMRVTAIIQQVHGIREE